MTTMRSLFAKGRGGEIIGGCITIFFGLLIGYFEDGTFYSRGYPVPRAVWILIVILGVSILIHGFKHRKIPKYDYGFVKCANCKNSFYRDQAKDYICPKCGSIVEDLEGYFDRHPNESPLEKHGTSENA